MLYDKYITFNDTSKVVEKKLDQLALVDLEYTRSTLSVYDDFYESVGTYDLFYHHIISDKEINENDILNYLTDLDDKYVKFRLMKNSSLKYKKWMEKNIYKDYHRVSVQSIFNKALYFDDRKVKLFSDRMKKVLKQREIKEVQHD